MKNVNQYHHRISVLFQSYLAGNLEMENLITELRKIETYHRQQTKTSKDLWFQFSKDDTFVTTIDDLEKDLSSAKNKEYILERIGEGISLENELFIYYS